ncbi:hypothetical protein evm_011884 [Chilo suppressalis]|nr:hypothetical protein evm_011884 [Chilo suppressalis]
MAVFLAFSLACMLATAKANAQEKYFQENRKLAKAIVEALQDQKFDEELLFDLKKENQVYLNRTMSLVIKYIVKREVDNYRSRRTDAISRRIYSSLVMKLIDIAKGTAVAFGAPQDRRPRAGRPSLGRRRPYGRPQRGGCPSSPGRLDPPTNAVTRASPPSRRRRGEETWPTGRGERAGENYSPPPAPPPLDGAPPLVVLSYKGGAAEGATWVRPSSPPQRTGGGTVGTRPRTQPPRAGHPAHVCGVPVIPRETPAVEPRRGWEAAGCGVAEESLNGDPEASHKAVYKPINVPTAGAQAFPMDGVERLSHDPPRGPSADWWVLTTADAGETNGLTCLPKHGGARDSNFWSPIQ